MVLCTIYILVCTRFIDNKCSSDFCYRTIISVSSWNCQQRQDNDKTSNKWLSDKPITDFRLDEQEKSQCNRTPSCIQAAFHHKNTPSFSLKDAAGETSILYLPFSIFHFTFSIFHTTLPKNRVHLK